MANETASLTVVVDSTSVTAAIAQLDLLTQAGARAEAAVGGLGGGAADATNSVAAMAPAVAEVGASMGTVTEASAALESSITKAEEVVNAFGETVAMADARHKAIAASYAAQAAAGGQIVLSERAAAEAAGLRVEATAEQIAATRAAVVAQDAQMTSTAEFIGVQAEGTAATNADTMATVRNTEAKVVNGQVAREIGVMIGELARGNYTRLEGSTITLANRTGFLASMFSLTGLAVVGTVGAIGALIATVVHASNQEDALNKAIISTGNYADVTTRQLKQMAAELQSSGVSYGQAIEVIGRLTSSGKIAGDMLHTAGQAAADMAYLTGQSMDKAAAEIERLAKDPANSVADLNDQFHFLTAAQSEQILTLEAVGNKADAAKIAIDAMGAVMHKRAMEAKQDGPWFVTAWDRWKAGMSNIGAGVSDILTLGGNKTKLDEYTDAVKRYREAVKQLEVDRANGRTGLQHNMNISTAQGAYDDVMKLWNDPAFKAERDKKQISAVVQGVQDDGVQATQTLAKLGITLDGMKSKQDKVKEAAAALYKAHLAGTDFPGVNFNGPAADLPQGAGWDEIVAKLDPKKKERTKKDPEVSAFDTFRSQVDSLENRNLGPADDPALKAYQQGIAKLADELDRYMAKNGDATKGAAEFNRGQQELQKTLDQSRIKQREADAAFDLGYAKKSLALQRSIDDQVDAIGMGSKEAQRTREVTKAYQDEADALAELALRRQEGKLTQDQYDHDVQTVKDATNKNVAAMQDGFKRIDAAQGNWLNGAKTAMKDYIDAGQNAASLTQGFFTNSMDSMTNALSNFATTGKLSFRSLVASILTDLAKMEMRIAASKILSSIIGGGTDNSAGGGGAQMASIFDGGWGGIATGGAFDSSGKITAFASGGIVDGAMPFTSGGKMGVLGEAGPEAIMPLSRGADGKLGVKSSGGGGNVININTSITVDKGGMQSQTSADNSDAMAKQLAGMMESKAKEVVMRATQPGGILWKQGLGA